MQTSILRLTIITVKNSYRSNVDYLIIPLSNLEKLVKKIDEIAKSDKGNNSKYSVEYESGESLTSDSKEFNEFINERPLRGIKEFSIYYYGKKILINLSFSINYGGIFRIEAEDRKDLITHKEELLRIFNEKSWNEFFHNFGYLLAIYISLLIFVTVADFLPIFSGSIYKFPEYTITLATILKTVPFLWVLLAFKLPSIYPSLVIKNNSETSGRILKQDLPKIVAVLIFPIIINILF